MRRPILAALAGTFLARMACAAVAPAPALDEALRWSRTYAFGESTGALLALEARWRETGTDPARRAAFVSAVATDLAVPGSSVDRRRFLCDLLARTAFGAAGMPVGAVTALLGGPFFLWLLFRRFR